jgi:hypothetical protein
MRVEDYYPNGKRWWVRLHEKGGIGPTVGDADTFRLAANAVGRSLRIELV